VSYVNITVIGSFVVGSMQFYGILVFEAVLAPEAFGQERDQAAALD
jgi:hypothetical protein